MIIGLVFSTIDFIVICVVNNGDFLKDDKTQDYILYNHMLYSSCIPTLHMVGMQKYPYQIVCESV